MGELPAWYNLMRAAKWMGVSPWDLLEAPLIWQDWALEAQAAEAGAEAQGAQSHQRRTGVSTSA